MSDRGAIPPELAEWIIRSLDGRITPEEFAKLDHELATNEAALRYYLEFVLMSTGLADRVGVLPKSLEKIPGVDLEDLLSVTHDADASHGPLRFSSVQAEEQKRREIEAYAQRQLEAFLRQEHSRERQDSRYQTPSWDLRDAASAAAGLLTSTVRTATRAIKIAAVCAFVAMLILVGYRAIRGDRAIATVVETVDARWSEPVNEGDELLPQALRLQQGYARIQFDKGAEIIVQAPARLDLLAGNKVFLQSGLLTAQVPTRAKGFTVDAPAARVVDYGTEFGMLVDKARGAEVHVFTGKVGMGASPDGAAAALTVLEEGQAALADTAHHITRSLIEDRPKLFARTLPDGDGFAVPGKRLNLADIVGGGNGFNTGVQGQGINPSTGGILTVADGPTMSGDGLARVPSSFYIDAVFIPGGSETPVITSTGVVFEGCPSTSGQCGDGIVNGAMFAAGPIGPHPGLLAGRAYGSLNSPSVGMAPNAGITFDLNAIRSSMPGVQIDAFQAVCGLSATIQAYEEARQAASGLAVTFWALVDGNVRFSEELKAVPLMAKWIDIPLEDKDRFLTLVVTSATDSAYAWTLFGEPALKLSIE